MPVSPTYPGVYVEEIPSGVRTIVGVATSITAFIGRALRGPTDTAVTINSFGDFERIFGGLWVESSLGFAVRDFYLNGGSQAVIIRLFHAPLSAADQTKAEDAAKAVAAAATGSDAAAAALAARTKANTYPNEPEKTAADKVATEAETASTKTDATPASVQAAANDAVAGAAPSAKTKLTVGDLPLVAAYEGKWGANLRVILDPFVEKAVAERMGLGEDDLFNLTVRDAGPGGATERFLNLSIKPSARRIDRVLEAESRLIRWYGDWPQPSDLPELVKLAAAQSAKKTLSEEQKKLAGMPANDPNRPAQQTKVDQAKTALETALNELVDPVTKAERALANAKKAVPQVPADITAAETALSKAINSMQDAVSDGDDLVKADDFTPNGALDEKKGLYALEQLFARDGLFNILCIPPYGEAAEERVSLVSDAAAYCEKRRAMLIVDPPEDWNDKSSARDKFTDPNNDNVGTRSRNAALFFPRLLQPNPLHENQIEEFVPCGVVAGIFARTDTQRGVWKAPAGLDATLVGVPQLSASLTDDENGELNPLGINCLRAFPIAGRVVWGSRTLRGADQLADEYKYIPVRRLALYIEESLYRGTQWVVFEPNDEPLWAQIRLNVGAFMHNLFRQGAFQGRTPREAYLVKCDKETTTQNDINLGIVNIVVGFAPLKPAEFVIIKIQQLAGQIEV